MLLGSNSCCIVEVLRLIHLELRIYLQFFAPPEPTIESMEHSS